MSKKPTIKELQEKIAHLEATLEKRNHEFSNEITELVLVKMDLEKRTNELNQRVRELKAVLQISSLSQTPDILMKDFYSGMLKIVIASFRHPEITCAELRIGDEVYQTHNFRHSPWKIRRGLMDQCHEAIGYLTVYYLEEQPDEGYGPFTKEEKNLLVMVSRYLVQIIKRNQYEEQNKIFHAVIAQSTTAILITNDQGIIEFVNSAFIKTLGYSPEELKEEFMHSILFGGESISKYEELKEVIKKGELWRGKLRAIRKDQQVIWIKLVIFPLVNLGNITNYVAIFNDITRQKIMEAAKQQQETIYKTLVESLPLAIAIYDGKGKFLYANSKTEQLFQQEKGSMTGKTFHQIFPKETADDQMKVMRQIFKTGQPLNSERSINWHGQIINVNIIREPLFDERGQVMSILAIGQDNTEVKRHEHLLKIQHQIDSLSNLSADLHTSMKMAFQNLKQIDWVDGGGIYLFDENNRYLMLVYSEGLSEEYVKSVSKYPVDSVQANIVLNKNPWYAKIDELGENIGPYLLKEKLKLAVSIPLVFQDKAIGSLNLGSRTTDHIKSNDKLIIESIAARLADLISLVQTRDKLTMVNQELNRSLKEVRENQDLLIQKSKLESLGRLSAGLAHEINQPLSVIALAFENITYKLMDSVVHKDYLAKKTETINQSIEKIRLLIDHFRLFARDQASVMFEKTDVNLAIKESLALTELQMARQQITIDLDLYKGNCFTLGNITKLEQVIMNLISNARDAVEEKRIKKPLAVFSKHIIIKSYIENQKIVVLVEDNGIGISQENMPKLFTPFFTTKPPGQGTGLGLAIVYAIVAEMKGTIEIFSEYEKYTRIYLVLPKI